MGHSWETECIRIPRSFRNPRRRHTCGLLRSNTRSRHRCGFLRSNTRSYTSWLAQHPQAAATSHTPYSLLFRPFHLRITGLPVKKGRRILMSNVRAGWISLITLTSRRGHSLGVGPRRAGKDHSACLAWVCEDGARWGRCGAREQIGGRGCAEERARCGLAHRERRDEGERGGGRRRSRGKNGVGGKGGLRRCGRESPSGRGCSACCRAACGGGWAAARS